MQDSINQIETLQARTVFSYFVQSERQLSGSLFIFQQECVHFASIDSRSLNSQLEQTPLLLQMFRKQLLQPKAIYSFERGLLVAYMSLSDKGRILFFSVQMELCQETPSELLLALYHHSFKALKMALLEDKSERERVVEKGRWLESLGETEEAEVVRRKCLLVLNKVKEMNSE